MLFKVSANQADFLYSALFICFDRPEKRSGRNICRTIVQKSKLSSFVNFCLLHLNRRKNVFQDVK